MQNAFGANSAAAMPVKCMPTMAAPITDAATSVCQFRCARPCGRLKAMVSAAIEAPIAISTEAPNRPGA